MLHHLAGRLGLAILLVLAGPGLVAAATLLGLDVAADGSVDPPGDRLDVRVLLFPGEDRLALETRVFARLEGRDEVVAVEAKGPDQRDGRGKVLIRTELAREADSQEATARIVVPFAALGLPVGRHQIAYEVRGLRDGREEFARATPMTVVVVSDRTRTTTRLRPERLVPRLSVEERTAYVLQGGKAVAQEIQLESEDLRPVRELRTAKVEIPGEFLRPAPPATRSAPSVVEEGPIQETVVPLERKPWAALSDFESKPKRTLYYATNRSVDPKAAPSPARFGNELGTAVTYGSCLVNIPVDHHTRGELEVPAHWWQARDPRKFFLVEALDTLPRDLFLQCLSSDDVLLFVHGYNTSFEAAVLRTAQLVHDLRFPGLGVSFSWPSAGTLSGYAHDEQVNAASVPALLEVLRLLSAPIGKEKTDRRIHVIVHSMGNRLFLRAARELELDREARGLKPPVFGHVALAAPDVDAATFAMLVPSVIRQSRSTTLYYCQSDRALIASRAVHLDKPVGLGPFFAEGLDTINADRANTSFLGHGYYASESPLLTDLMLTILLGQKPEERHPPLGRRSLVLGYAHWWLLGSRP
jgi:esterase/lipase superfamily enzyme